MTTLRDGISSALAKANGVLASLAAWPGWPLLILAMTTFAWALNLTEKLLVILSVQASVASAVMDIRQRKAAQEENDRREAEEKRDALLRETVEDVEALALEIKAMADSLIDMVEAAARRDRLNAKSQKMILTALESRGDLYDFLLKGGVLHDRTRAATRRTGNPRKANGRANRKRS